MIRLVCYDISDPKRLARVAKILEAYGLRLQKSCFQCDTQGERYLSLLRELGEVMDAQKDSLIAYAICEDCVRLSITDGPGKIIDPDACIIL